MLCNLLKKLLHIKMCYQKYLFVQRCIKKKKKIKKCNKNRKEKKLKIISIYHIKRDLSFSISTKSCLSCRTSSTSFLSQSNITLDNLLTVCP